MQTLLRQEANAISDQLWLDLRSEWFKVEVLQDYSGEDSSKSLHAWLAGDKEQSIALLREEQQDWTHDCRQKVSQGVTLTRIHIIDYPLSEYIKWEIEAYKHRNIPLGKERVYIVDRKDIAELTLPRGDFMIFDYDHVAVGDYDETGKMVAQTFYGKHDNIAYFLTLRKKLLNAKLQEVMLSPHLHI